MIGDVQSIYWIYKYQINHNSTGFFFPVSLAYHERANACMIPLEMNFGVSQWISGRGDKSPMQKESQIIYVDSPEGRRSIKPYSLSLGCTQWLPSKDYNIEREGKGYSGKT